MGVKFDLDRVLDVDFKDAIDADNNLTPKKVFDYLFIGKDTSLIKITNKSNVRFDFTYLSKGLRICCNIYYDYIYNYISITITEKFVETQAFIQFIIEDKRTYVKSISFYKNDIAHKAYGPAYIEYSRNGYIDDVMFFGRYKINEVYYINGRRHRANGPAVIKYSVYGCRCFYYIHDKPVSSENFFKIFESRLDKSSKV